MHTVAFKTLGCKLNQAETAMMIRDFTEQGYRVVRWDTGADVTVLNTCTVTGRSDSKCRQAIRHALRINPDTTMIVAGCYAQVSAPDIAEIPGVDYIVGICEKYNLPGLIAGPGKLKNPCIRVAPVSRLFCAEKHGPGLFADQTRAFLKIQSGCDNACAYCIVPVARGPSRSVPVEEVLRHAGMLVREGHREIVVTGVHIGQYGHGGLPVLLQRLTGIEGLKRIRLSSLDPDDVTDDLLDLIAGSDRICNHLHIPMQSGSDIILKAMNRKYGVRDLNRIVEKIAGRLVNFGLGTDIIAGFPGETDAMHRETMDFVASLPFSYLHVFPFSRRQGTRAADMKGQVAHTIIQNRINDLKELGRQKKKKFQEKYLNRDVTILTESRSTGKWMGGFSPEYLRVEIPRQSCPANELVTVHVTSSVSHAVRGHVCG